MWRPDPPSLAWLLRHEARVGGRNLGGVRSKVVTALGVLVMVLFHGAAWVAMRVFDMEVLLAHAAPLAIFFTAFAMLLMLGSAFGIAAHALFERGDFDLLLSSPVPVQHVFAARALYVALACTAAVGLFVLPFANMGPLHGKWGTLAAYPVLFAYGLACSAIAFLAAFALVRVFGPRRARVVAQVLGAVLGAVLVLAMQVPNLLPAAGRETLRHWESSEAVREWLSSTSPLAWPLRALAGDAWLTPAFVAAGVALFAAVVRSAAPRFAAAAQQSLAAPRPKVRVLARRPFRSGLARIVVTKELLLIARDPALIGRSLLQLIYLLPLFLVLVRNSQPPALAAAALVLLAMSLAGNLAWVTVSGEEAPELLASAPISGERVRSLKAAAALLPVAVLMVPFVLWYLGESWRSAAVLGASLAAALVTSAVMQVWTARPAAKRDLRLRHKQNPLVNIAEHLSGLGWSGACYLALSGTGGPWWLLAVALAILPPASVWLLGRSRRAV
jgi:ABC-2 type transport system permease protein